MKLFPILAEFYAYSFGSEFLKKQYYLLQEEVKKDDFHRLYELHHFSSGMKSVYTQNTVENILVARQSVGGAGFTQWSALPQIYESANSLVTLEGDNTVMSQ